MGLAPSLDNIDDQYLSLPDSRTFESFGTNRPVLTEPGSHADRHIDASEDQPHHQVEN